MTTLHCYPYSVRLAVAQGEFTKIIEFATLCIRTFTQPSVVCRTKQFSITYIRFSHSRYAVTGLGGLRMLRFLGVDWAASEAFLYFLCFLSRSNVVLKKGLYGRITRVLTRSRWSLIFIASIVASVIKKNVWSDYVPSSLFGFYLICWYREGIVSYVVVRLAVLT